MNYTLNQLQIYLKVVQTMSITKAAEELNLTQPAVSIQIKNFQAQFEIPLIEIIGKKIYVTDFGHEIAKSAEGIIDQVYAINYKTMAFKDKLLGRLKISIVSTGKYVMPYFLTGFLKNNPGVEISMDVTNREKVFHSLENNEVDFSLISTDITSPSFDHIEILENDLYLVGNPQTAPLNPSFAFKEFNQELPLIFRENGSGTRKVMEGYLKKQGIHDIHVLHQTVEFFLKRFGQCTIETDMRAMHNATRMRVIDHMTASLIQQIKTYCPSCQAPGFRLQEKVRGLPCGVCGKPTRSVQAELYACQSCSYTESRPPGHGMLKEDPMYCDTCNP